MSRAQGTPLNDMHRTTRSTLISRIQLVELRVRDVDRSLGFYRDVVGLRVIERSENVAVLGAAGSPVLSLSSAGVVKHADPRATGLYHTAIRFPDRASLADALARLVEAGFRIGAADHGVSEALYIDDPDNNGVELYRDRSREQWPPEMTTAPLDLHALVGDSRGQDAIGGEAPRGTDIGHVHLQVSDLERTKDFYVAVLGLDLMAEFPGQAGFFSSGGYHHHLGANTWHSRGGRPAGPDHAGLQRVRFEVGDRSDLDDAETRLRANSYDLVRTDNELIVRDPDEIELRFTVPN